MYDAFGSKNVFGKGEYEHEEASRKNHALLTDNHNGLFEFHTFNKGYRL